MEPSLRGFRNGSWDLRKDERRQLQAPIPFPERRSDERRSFPRAESQIMTAVNLVEDNRTKKL